MHNYTGPNIIGDEEDDASIANVFCFEVFADKQSGVMYNDLTGNFSFILLDGSVCFLVMYHYESNAIFAIPIAGLEDITIFEAYKKKFDELTAKGLKVKINIMDIKPRSISRSSSPKSNVNCNWWSLIIKE